MRSIINNMLLSGFFHTRNGWIGSGYFDGLNQRVPQPNQLRWGWGQMFPVDGTLIAAPALGGYTVTGQTVSTPTISSASLLDQAWRTRYTSATGTNSACGTGPAAAQSVISSTPRVGGFVLSMRFANTTNVTGNRAFIGVATTIPVIESANLGGSTTAYAVGIGYDSGDSSTGTWSFFANNATSTAKVSLTGMTRSANTIYEFWIWNRPGSQNVGYWVYDMTNDAEVVPATLYTTTANIPNNQVMFPQMSQSTGTDTTAVVTDVIKWGFMSPLGG